MNTQNTDSKKNSALKHNIPYKGPTNRKTNSFQKKWDTLFHLIPALKILFKSLM